MNGAQDMGGQHGFGAVVPEPNEPAFHAEWERRAFALTLAMGATGEWNLDQARSARESIPPAEYLAKSYYDIWFTALETMLKERELLRNEEIVAGHASGEVKPVAKVLAPEAVLATLGRGGPTSRSAAQPQRFQIGDRVRAKNMHPVTHTRLPRYVRGRAGVVERVHGCHVFPDVHASGTGEDPQWLYTVRFDGRELWGEGTDPTVAVSVDAFEPYLEAV